MAKKTPPDPKLFDTAKKLADAGATAELDKLIKNAAGQPRQAGLPRPGQGALQVRFESDSDGNEQASLKQMCKLMEDMPGRRDRQSEPEEDRAQLGRRGLLHAVEGRGDDELAAGGEEQGRLPAGRHRAPSRARGGVQAGEQQPRGPVRLQHAARGGARHRRRAQLHGHHGKEPDHGGWIEIGGAVDQIVAAVLKETGFGKEPEAKQYVLDRILRNPADAADHLRRRQGAVREVHHRGPDRRRLGAARRPPSWPRSTAASTRSRIRTPGPATRPRRARRASPATSSARPASGSPSSMRPGSSAS